MNQKAHILRKLRNQKIQENITQRSKAEDKQREWHKNHSCTLCHRNPVEVVEQSGQRLCTSCHSHEKKSINVRLPEWIYE